MKILVGSKGYAISEGAPSLLVCALSAPAVTPRSSVFVRRLDQTLGGKLALRMQEHGFECKHLAPLLLSPLVGAPESALIVGWKPSSAVPNFETISDYRKLGDMVGDRARKARAARLVIACDTLKLDRPEFLRAFIEGLELGGYSFKSFKGKKDKKKEDKPDRRAIDELVFAAAPKGLRPALWEEALAGARATALARDLVNTPPNVCTPSFLAERARAIAKEHDLELKIYSRAELRRMGANLLLAVSQGSSEEPCLITLRYRPRGKASRRVALVGKGVTFDSGGLCVKSMGSMSTMKSDMAGAAAVLGVMSAVRALEPRAEVLAYIPATENMINGEAMRLGDVYTGMNGTTVEILNTDAEGRLILADALTLASREGVDEIVDIATLTGASMVALGTEYAGLFSTDDTLARGLITAGEHAGERMWRLPLAPEYRENIDSAVADIKNTGGQYGGAITAALFLKEFVTVKKYAHLDIAGPSFRDGDKGYLKKGGTGVCVRSLLNYLRNA